MIGKRNEESLYTATISITHCKNIFLFSYISNIARNIEIVIATERKKKRHENINDIILVIGLVFKRSLLLF